MQEISNETNSPPERGSRKGVWIGVAVALALLLAGIGGAVWVGNTFDKHLESGQAAIAQGDWTTAVSSFDQALNVQPAFLQRQPALAQGLRGLARYQQNSLGVALADLDAALAADDSLIDLRAYRSDIHFRQGDLSQALADSEAALAADVPLPDSLRALLAANRAVTFVAEGDLAAAEREAAAGLALAAYLSAEQVGQLQAIEAAHDLAANGDEAAAALAQAVLATDTPLPDGLRARLYAGQTAVFHNRGDLAAALAASEAALTLAEELDEATVAGLHETRAAVYLAQEEWETAVAEAELAAGTESALYQSILAWQAYRQFDEAAALAAAEAALALDEENALAYRVRGTVRAWQGHVRLALDDLQRALELDPQDVEAAAMLVDVAQRLNDETLAETAVAQAIAANPNAPATLWAQAMQHIYYYRFPEARAYLDAAIALDDTRPEFYALRALAYTLTADSLTLGAADEDAALALNPDFGLALLARFGTLMLNDDREAADALTLRLLELRPDWHISHLLRGQYLIYMVRDEEAALTAFNKTIELLPESASGYSARGFVYLGREELEEAEAEFNQALTVSPYSNWTRSGLVELALIREAYDQALALIEEAIERNPYDLDILADQARVLYFFLDERDAGWALIHDIVARDPLQSKAVPMQAFFYADAGDLDRSIQIVTDHLETFPNDSFALELRAQFYLEQGDLNAARQDARRVVVLAPDTVEAYRVLTIAAWDEGRLAEARNHAQKMLENDPESLEAYRLLGLLALNSGDPETAVATFDEALDTIPDNDLLHFYRGIAHAESGAREQAENDLTRALQLSENLNLIVDIERALVESAGLPDIEDGKYVITNQEYGFTIAYTDPWMRQNPEPGSPIDVLLVYDTVDYYAHTNVVALDGLEAGLTPRDFFNLFSSELRNMPGLTSLATRNVQIGEVTAYLHDYELVFSSDLVLRGRQYIFVSGNRAAIVTCETYSEYFEAMLPEFEAIIATFVLSP